MKLASVREVECPRITRVADQEFMQRHGYVKEFSSDLMVYSSGREADCRYEVMQYEDKYYIECHNVIRGAFHRTQVSVGLEDESYGSPPNEKEKQRYLDDSKSMYLMRVNG
jgi:hypothetical protein